jgi:hypothetical protein
MRVKALFLGSVLSVGVVAAGGNAGAKEHDQIDASALIGARAHYGDAHAIRAAMSQAGGKSLTVNGRHSGLKGIDSIVNFTGQYTFPGFDSNGNPQSVWPWAMIGRSPRSSAITLIGAPIIPVSLDLRDANGNPRFVNGKPLISDATQFVNQVVNSPIFHPVKWSTSEFPTQYIDAFMRAQFWHGAGDGDFDRDDHVSEFWHTFLLPIVQTPRTMVLKDGTYQFALNPDGTCCFVVLVDAGTFGNALFPPTPDDTTTPIGAAENAGEMTTKELSTLLFPNTFLYEGTPNNCCILGFHSIDEEPDAKGNLTKFYTMAFASWISPGIFSGGFGDITALSHELAEAFDDPFVSFDGVHNQTQWWQAPAPFDLCQNNLEVGDVIEGLDNATFPVTIDGFTYHPQNEALLQWFAGQSPSSAFHGAYSFPDTTVLTTPAGSLPVNCGQPSTSVTVDKPAPLL